MEIELSRSIPGDHPCVPHHFPGNPIIPGVVILAEVINACRASYSEYRVAGFPRVKFAAPLHPDETFTIGLSAPDKLLVRFECKVGQGLLAKGQLRLASQSAVADGSRAGDPPRHGEPSR